MIIKKEMEILEAIKGSGGIISKVAKRLCCSWHTANKLCNRTKKTRQAIEDETETLLDEAENTIIAAIKNGDVHTAKWLLITKGKNRGYTARNELLNVNYDEKAVKEIQRIFNTTIRENKLKKIG